MVKQGEKRTVKRARARSSILIDSEVGLQKGDELSFINSKGERIICPWEVRTVTPQLTKAEKEKARRLYRQEYMKKPETIEKLKERSKDPLVVQKKKEYADRLDVKMRKKELAAKSRAIRRAFKENDPEKYAELQKRVEEALYENKWMSQFSEHELMPACDDPQCELHGSSARENNSL